MAEEADKGYSWLVLLCAFLSQTIHVGISMSSGVFYVLFINHVSADHAALALISALNFAVFCIAGPISAYLIKLFGVRCVHNIGALIGCIALLTTAVAKGPYLLGFSFGILNGFGFGLSFISTFHIVSVYFDKHRSLAIGLLNSGAGLGTLVIPPITRLFYEYYGYQGSLIMMAGLALHLFVLGTIFKPPYFKEIPVKEIDDGKEEKKGGIIVAFNCRILMNPSYLLLCMSNICCAFGLSVIYVHFAAYASTFGFSETSCAMLYSISGLCGFISRVTFSFVGLKLNPVYIYPVTYIIMGGIVLFIPLAKTYSAFSVFAGFIGLYHAIYSYCLPLLIMEFLTIELLSFGYGISTLFTAVGQVMGGPFASILYKATGYYSSSMYLGGAMTILAGIIMVYPCVKFRQLGERLSKDISIKEPMNTADM